MKKISYLIATAGFAVVISQAASAADLPRKAPAYVPPAPPPITWTGCYVGANIGGAYGRFKLNSPFGEESDNQWAFAGGGQVGCDYQFAGGWVIGFRDMFDGTTNSDHNATLGIGPLAGAVVDFKNTWFDTLTGRIGYALQPAWLIYGQGGAAWGHVETDLTFAGAQIGSWSTTRTGWTVGGGVEWRFAPQWSAFLEGNYMDFGSHDDTVFVPVACAAGCNISRKTTAATVLVGANYRFWSGL